MEQWEALIEACPTLPELRYFSKAVQTASVVLKEDLANFEKEWILQTLLYKPVDLIAIVATKRTEDSWSKAIADAFKLLAKVTDGDSAVMETHFDDVVKICLLSFDAHTRINALECLRRVAAVSPCGAREVGRHIAHLEEGSVGKAPTALLIGTICEHHPETVENEINKIWRLFLNLLDSNKNTERITSCLLQGILGLFKHFGCDLPTAELGQFYDKLVADYITLRTCEDVCLQILANHANLFRERISKDVRIRNLLWNILYNSTGTAVNGVEATISVYKSICGCVSKDQLQRIATAELIPQTVSHRTRVKYTALRLLTFIRTNYHVNIEVDGQTDGHVLEVELREGSVSYDVANKVSWYIESNLPGSDNLLQTAIVFYNNLPANKRKEIVVHGILNATDELRTAAVKFLITESTLDGNSIENYQSLWKDMFDTNNGKDYIVVDKSRLVFEEFMSYAIFVLEGFLEEGLEKLPEKLLSLVQLTGRVLEHQPREDCSNDYCIVLLPILTHLLKLNPDAVTMCAARRACSHVADPADNLDTLAEFYQVIRIDQCKDEALLCESCLALLQADIEAVDTYNVLMALQITFSRNDVEPQILSKALQKLQNIIIEKNNLDPKILNDIIHCVEKLHDRKALGGKDERMLHRDVLMFLGKYGNKSDSHIDTAESTIIVKLMETLTLNVANPEQGRNYKLNLQSILQLALEHEEPSSLQTLLVIICANLATKQDENLQRALTRACVALSRAHARGAHVDARALQAAVAMCDTANCVLGLLQYISEEKSPGVRKMLSDALEALLIEDHDDRLSSSVAEQATVMMGSTESTKKRAGLNITETLISSLKENNALIKKLLPELLVLISKTFEIYSEMTFEIGSKLFLEKIELFDQSEIEKLLKTLLGILIIKSTEPKIKMAVTDENKMSELDVKIFKNTTKMILEFVKAVIDYKKEDRNKIWGIILEIFGNEACDFEKQLFVLAKCKDTLGGACDLDSELLDTLFCMEIRIEEPYFTVEAVLLFLQKYADMLLDLHYQMTLNLLKKLITELTPQCIKHLHRNIKSCLSVYTKKTASTLLLTSFETWCHKIPVEIITNSIEKDLYTTEHSIMVFALKTMLTIFDSTLVDLSKVVQKWSKILLKRFSNGYITKYLKSKVSYLTDILTVSLKFTKMEDVKKLILEGSALDGMPTEKVGIKFSRFFMHVFYDFLVENPILLDEDMSQCCVLLNDIVKFTLRKRCTDEQCSTVLDLVDKLWPKYEVQTTFIQKQSLLLDVNNFPKKLGPESKPLQWAVTNVMRSETSREERARLIGVFPAGDSYSPAYRCFASTLPTRLSELRGECGASLRAMLDALANTGDLSLLGIVITLAGGDDTKGWWDEAIDACMASLAPREDLALCTAVYTRSKEGLSLGVCRRMLLPLLRYSSSKFNEEFFSTILNDLFVVKKQLPSNHHSYYKRIVTYTHKCSVLQVAFEKIPPTSLESPSSRLYKHMNVSQSWHIVRTSCRICNDLRDVKLPEDADVKFIEDYRQFQCANYNCFAAAVCRRRPDAKFYDHLFKIQVWDAIVDTSKEYHLWIRHQWNQRTKRQPVSIDVQSAPASSLTSLRASVGTVRTRMFLRTLSENPLMYDLIEDTKTEEIKTQDIQLPSNELNEHECSSTVTALVCHVASLPHTTWRHELAHATSQCNRNTRWWLAQIMCNCKEELKPHASALRPALLELVVSTPVQVGEKKVLNGLHIDILETVIHWKDTPLPRPSLNSSVELLITTALEQRQHVAVFKTLLGVLTNELKRDRHIGALELKHNEMKPFCLETVIHWKDTPSPSPSLDSIVELLITTALEHRQQVAVFKTVLGVLTRLLGLYATVVNVAWTVFEPYLTDTGPPETLQILQLLTKSNVYLHPLLPTLINKLENEQYYQLSVFAELLGLALNAYRDRQPFIIRFRKVLDQVRRTNAAEYVKVLYYAQKGCAECCDEYNFRMITSLSQELTGHDKRKSLRILSTYISTYSSQYAIELYETIDLAELITEENIEAFNLVKEGVNVMNEHMKIRLVMLVAGFCEHATVDVRKAANEVMLKAFEDLFGNYKEPPAKKTRTTSSQLVSKILSKDKYATTILNSLACGAIDKDSGISSMVREGLAKMLHKDMGIRFTECFFLTIYLPATCNNKAQRLSVCASALLEMLLIAVRSQETFKTIRLRDEPLEFRLSRSAPSKLLTMSRTYQGTFRRHSTLTRRHQQIQADTNQNSAEIDVQIPIERILDTFIQFSKDTPEVASELCLQLIRAIYPTCESGSEVAVALAAILQRGVNELTPFVADVCGVFIDDLCKIDGIQATIQELNDVTNTTEEGHTIKLLLQEVKLRCDGHEQFVLGGRIESGIDVVMEESEFSIEDLTSVFNKLANWDCLTVQQKIHIQNSGLPPLWTDKETFKEQLENYTPSVGWFSKMAAAYKQTDKHDAMKWLREMDRWPRRHFQSSAITEAIEWQDRRESNMLPGDIQPADCLAEWAARLMIRDTYQSSLVVSDSSQERDTSYELEWCERANEMQLGSLVIGCVNRNIPCITYEKETLPWLRQKVWALRQIGLRNNDDDILQRALTIADRFTVRFSDDTAPDVVIGMNKLIVLLNMDLNSLSKEKLEEIYQIVESANKRSEDEKNKQNLYSIYALAMTYYDDLWENNAVTESDQNAILSDMIDILTRCSELNMFDEGLLAVILNKLDDFKGKMINENIAKKLLDQIHLNQSAIDDFTFEQLSSHSSLFPSRSLTAFIDPGADEAVRKYMRCFESVSDAQYSLLQYCKDLSTALKNSDEDQWEAVFRRMKNKLFDNPYSGSDYQLLNRYKTKLQEIREYDTSPSFKMAADRVVQEIGRALSQRAPQSVLRLSQLCPALSRCEDCPGKLLGLRDNQTVVRIYEQVTVCNSIRRPAVFKVLLSDGTTRRYLHKSGEPLKVDAAAQKVLRYAGQLWKGKCPVVGYNVTLLSEDSGLIEYLENYDTLRSLIGTSDELNAALESVQRPNDQELILASPHANLAQYYQLCDKIPARALRDSVIRRSATEQHRLFKINNFQNTLASSIIVTWILGVGDRHLENILCSVQDGGLCHIDWGAVQYGCGEIPPARATRGLQCACDTLVLEARLQQLLSCLRDSHRLLLAVVKIAFKWMEEFTEKFAYIESILRGSALSYNVTRDALDKCEMQDSLKNKYIELLDNVFQDFESKEHYRVDEQISCLLRQCTDPRILSVTRSGWEPWI